MTTIDAVAAWRAWPKALTVLAAVFCLGLGGCETATNLFSSADDTAAPSLALTDPNAVPAAPQTARLSIAPIIGAPDAIAKQLQVQLTTAIESQKVTVAKTPGEKADYTLRGYIVSARERSGTKISYIWDVTDPAGKRAHRVTGEEVVPGTQGKDPWASVTPQVVDTIAGKTASSLASWMPVQAPAAVAAGTPAVGTPTPVTSQPVATVGTASPAQTGPATAPSAAPPTPVAAVTPAATAPSKPLSTTPSPTTGSIERAGAANAMVPTVSGAPGDGSVSLTSAIQRELSKSGVSLTDKPTGQTYRVEGKVVVGQGKSGKQPIQIDWDVKDPQGKKLGTVSQKNEIPQGSLDGAWGKTADAAAAAAAQGILKLLPQQTKTN